MSTFEKIEYLFINYQNISEAERATRLKSILEDMQIDGELWCQDCQQQVTAAQLAKRIFPIRITHGDCMVAK